jgi:hypothetical protein
VAGAVAPPRPLQPSHGAATPAAANGMTVAPVPALAFAVTNGVHDAANAIAALVATQCGRCRPC